MENDVSESPKSKETSAMPPLIRGLEAAEEPYVVLSTGSGAEAVVVPRGARVIGLFDACGDNFLWTPSSLSTPEGAKSLLHATEWQNVGGDRTWIGPEVGTRVPDLSDPWGTIMTPQSFDPGRYTLRQVGAMAWLRTEGELQYYRPETEVGFAIEKTIRLVANPLRGDVAEHPDLGSLTFAGYEQVTRLQVVGRVPSGAFLCLWSLPVLPGSGEIIIPTHYRARVRDFMEPTGEAHLAIEDRCVRFRLDGRERHKIGIKPGPLTGRMGYVRALDGGDWTLVVRNFFVNPSAEYVEVPWDDPTDLGYAVEIYNHNGQGGEFGEMEYHAPAIGGDTGLDSYLDRSQLWAFRGPADLIRVAGDRLLGSGVLPSLEVIPDWE